ncbi:MAG: C4-dicarboxylate ABC transporter permease [Spirochaetae bacterium HGW-Spirochaetae-8]|jgi:C4-dicarboxylate transporter DctM subunit|nr:MAG: C4-dicarboxylate ABC transporter permease [Spirochaetae bacterium HGW-Spirochaetae-8]
MQIAILLSSFFFFLAIGVPIAFALGISSLTYIILFLPNVPFSTIAQQMFGGVNSFTLTAIPFFILVGAIMDAGGISKRLVEFIKTLVGHRRGGLGMIALFSSVIFASLSGSSVANVAATGAITIPLMKKNGYPKGMAAAIEASSSSLGAVIPPSLPFIVYGGLTSLSIGSLFIGGYIPGILFTLGILTLLILKARKLQVPISEKCDNHTRFKTFISAFPALLTPFLIMGGILGGVMTPTEAGAIGCVYAFIVSFVVYRELKLKDIPKILIDAAVTTGFVMLVMSIASLFGWIMAFENIPTTVANVLISVLKTPTLFMVGIVLLMIIVGTFIDTLSALIILGPVLLPAANLLGIDPLHFGLILCMSLSFGVLTPPVGTCLFVAAGIAETSVEDTASYVIPFVVILFGGTLLMALFPNIVLWLPRLTGYAG